MPKFHFSHSLSVMLLCIVCVLTLYIGGCSSKPTAGPDILPAQQTEQTIACPLSKEEIEAAVGEKVKDPISRDAKRPFGQRLYIYRGAADGSNCFVQISVVRSENMTAAAKERGMTAPKLFYDTKEKLNKVTPVADIGDDAYWGTPGLHVLIGDLYLTITVGYVNKKHNLSIAKDLAQKVLPRLDS